MKTSELLWKYADGDSVPHAIAGIYFDSGVPFCSVCETAIIDHVGVNHTYSARQLDFSVVCKISVGYSDKTDYVINIDRCKGIAVEEDTW